jgi:hypothetical protein
MQYNISTLIVVDQALKINLNIPNLKGAYVHGAGYLGVVVVW